MNEVRLASSLQYVSDVEIAKSQRAKLILNRYLTIKNPRRTTRRNIVFLRQGCDSILGRGVFRGSTVWPWHQKLSLIAANR